MPWYISSPMSPPKNEKPPGRFLPSFSRFPFPQVPATCEPLLPFRANLQVPDLPPPPSKPFSSLSPPLRRPYKTLDNNSSLFFHLRNVPIPRLPLFSDATPSPCGDPFGGKPETPSASGFFPLVQSSQTWSPPPTPVPFFRKPHYDPRASPGSSVSVPAEQSFCFDSFTLFGQMETSRERPDKKFGAPFLDPPGL